MKWLQFSFNLTDDLAIKDVVIDWNDTGLPSDSKLIKMVAIALLKSIKLNEDTLAVQDLLNELDIKVMKP